MTASRARVLAVLFALAGGALWAFAFGRQGMVIVPWLALAPLPLLLGARRPALLGLLWGLATWLTAIPWIARVLRLYGELSWGLAVFSLFLLALYLSLFPALFAALGARLWRRDTWSTRSGSVAFGLPLVGLPALWVSLEWLRTHLFSGFPWNLAAYAWVEVPGALPLSAWIGVYGVSFLVVFVNTGVALSIARRRWQPAVFAVSVTLVLLAAGRAWGGGSPVFVGPEPEPVRLVQPDIENELQPTAETVAANYRKMLRRLGASCEPGALVVLPESSFWPFVYTTDRRLQRDLRTVLAAGRCTVLLNSVEPLDGDAYNSVYLIDASGLRGRYDKRHLVPFGEYVPLSRVFVFLDTVARNAGGFVPGDTLRLLPWGDERLGTAVCFEVTFPSEVAQLVRAGATLLVTVTNDAWYGDSWAPWQHLRAARFRAAENRRPMLRAAITGVTALIAADGSVRAEIGLYRDAVIRERVLGRRDLSPASRWPWLAPLLCTLAAAAALGFAIITARRLTGSDGD